MQPPLRLPRSAVLWGAVFLAMPVVGVTQPANNQIDITTVAIEGKTAEICTERVEDVARQARKLSLATRPPFDLSDGLRAFYDHTLRLDAHGELASTAVLSTAYVTGYAFDGEHQRRSVAPFMRVEVSRPSSTPPDAPSHITMSWLWMQRIAPAADRDGRPIERPHLHRFDFVGEVEPTYGVWGHAIARCRASGDRQWFGAVAVWTYLPP